MRKKIAIEMQMSLYWMMSQFIKSIAYFKHVFLVYNVAKCRTN